MHARTDELLSIRDGEPLDAAVRAHVESCRECGAAVARLRAMREMLTALPAAQPDPSLWPAVESRLAERAQPNRRTAVPGWIAAAASVATIAVVFALRAGDGARETRLTQRAVAIAAPSQDSVEALQKRSLVLERALASLPSRPAVERAETSIPIDTLEQRVQWLDQRLSVNDATGTEAQDAERLWQERVAVMSSLVRLRYVEAQRVAL